MADNEKLERLLDELQEATARKVELFAKAQELQSMIDLMDKKQELLRNDIMSLFKQDVVEEPDPNPVPEGVPPVTDMEEVQKVTGRGGKPKRILMMNMETGEEKQFPSKTMAAQFLSITQQYLAKILKDEGAFKGWWITEAADTPTA